jgi:hypothetical protein
VSSILGAFRFFGLPNCGFGPDEPKIKQITGGDNHTRHSSGQVPYVPVLEWCPNVPEIRGRPSSLVSLYVRYSRTLHAAKIGFDLWVN